MSSTEQKNVTQPFIDCCFRFGVLPTILTKAFDGFKLETQLPPFEGLGNTANLGSRLRESQDPFADAIHLLPTLRHAGPVSRSSPLLLRLCTDSKTYSGNQAVLRFSESITNHRWGLHVRDTMAIKHARKHTCKVMGLLAPAGYSNIERTTRNANGLQHTGDANFLRTAAELVDYINKTPAPIKYTRAVRQWCHKHRDAVGLKSRYRKTAHATEDYRAFDPSTVHDLPDPPALPQKWFTVNKSGTCTLKVYSYGGLFFIKVSYKHSRTARSTLLQPSAKKHARNEKIHLRREVTNELYMFTRRDLDDMRFILHAGSQILSYHARRVSDVLLRHTLHQTRKVMITIWTLYKDVMEACGRDWELRNKLGVYFDVLQWRYLAWRSGDIFYDHSQIMARKIESKGLSKLPSQTPILVELKKLPMDIAVDLLGIYKASIYPEVDPFKVVCDQYQLHQSRFQTDWPDGSPERERFEDTKSYMWYFGVRVLHQRNGLWPGRIRKGSVSKPWHERYHRDGIPGDSWREAHDVDLTAAIPVTDISNEQYMRQQDSACAPPLAREYASFEAMKKAPRKHRRKLLYAVQEHDPPDLPAMMHILNEIGRKLPDGYTDRIQCNLPFSTDIVTGSRCERHKDAPRPFYAASPPWGCIISYFDGLTRDFLNFVPQSMLGKSTKQKYEDLHAAERHFEGASQAFYMSDDKAKYSPRMDPNSQQMPADFFAELFDIPAIKAFGPLLYHNQLYYRVCGHLVSYGSNGTDREGMRGASNTWLEIVAQGLTTRLSRERGLIVGRSRFLSFIDDGLRKFSVNIRDKTQAQILSSARKVIDDVVFGLKVLGRELSWDKTFISPDLFVILNEIVYNGTHISSGLKSFVTAGDIDMKEVMSAPDFEQLYFGKMRGAFGVGAPLDLCHYMYIYETIMSHYRLGLTLQDNAHVSYLDYRIFCITPVALGGAGIKSMTALACNEVASATEEGIGTLQRLASDRPILTECIDNIMNCELEQISPIDFMREPEQYHVTGPRLRTQRLAAEVRKHLRNIASNPLSQRYLDLDREGMIVLERLGKTMMATGQVSAEEIRLAYAMNPVSFVDEFIQKLASSTTLSEIIGKDTIALMRRLVRRDLKKAAEAFRHRTKSTALIEEMQGMTQVLASINYLMY